MPLGDWHHQGVLLEKFPTVRGMLANYGPSLQEHKQAFLALLAEKLGERDTGALQRWIDQFLPPEVLLS